MKVIVLPPALVCSGCGAHLLSQIDIEARMIRAECASHHCASHEVEISIPVTEIEGIVTRTKDQP